jgi:Mrp family chromosome partitioning ATPase
VVRPTVDELRAAVDVEPQGDSDLIGVSATWTSPEGAVALANEFAGQIVARRREASRAEAERAIDALNGAIASSTDDSGQAQSLKERIAQIEVLKRLDDGGLRLVRPADSAVQTSPRPLLYTVTAAFVSFVLGLGLVALLAVFDGRIRDERELTELISAPVLARIPSAATPGQDAGTASVRQRREFIEAFHFLALNLQLLNSGQGGSVVAVTSPEPGDGKTTVVAWLATLLSGDSDVVAVDFDLHDPQLHPFLSALTQSEEEVLAETSDEHLGNGFNRRPGQSRLRVVLGGDHSSPLSGVTAEAQPQNVLERLRATADYVLVDTSAICAFASATAVAAAADGVIFVVDLKRIRRRELQYAKTQLANARANVIGIVLNSSDGVDRAYTVPAAVARRAGSRAPTGSTT